MIDRDALHQIVLDHAGQVYDATVTLRQNVRATLAGSQPAEQYPPWAELSQSQRHRFMRDTPDAMADLQAAVETVNSNAT